MQAVLGIYLQFLLALFSLDKFVHFGWAESMIFLDLTFIKGQRRHGGSLLAYLLCLVWSLNGWAGHDHDLFLTWPGFQANRMSVSYHALDIISAEFNNNYLMFFLRFSSFTVFYLDSKVKWLSSLKEFKDASVCKTRVKVSKRVFEVSRLIKFIHNPWLFHVLLVLICPSWMLMLFFRLS